MEIRPILSALMRNKTGPLLVAVQVALSLAILANALHIVSERQAVADRLSGVEREEDIFHLRVNDLQTESTFNEMVAAQVRQGELLRAVPGVLSVAQTNQVPLSRSGNNTSMAGVPTQLKPSTGAAFYVSPDSLVKTWGLKLVEGRDFLPTEVVNLDSTKGVYETDVIIVTQALARKVWPDAASYVGKSIWFGTGKDATSARVVGVVERLQSTGAEVGERGEMSIIQPLRRISSPRAMFTVRAEPGQRERVMKETEAALRKAANNQIIVRSKTLEGDRLDRYRADRGLAWMLVTVSVLLMLVTASGIVGMASLWVTQRRKQIGVRRALGARRVDILRYFITENVMITSAGVAAGLVGALGLNHLLVTNLELARLPGTYLVAGAAIFLGLGIAAVYGPAWRAASISPATATRGVV
ncbi:FtsX-like permease family protein [Pseudoduganella umbonata]|uniref:FtsX-like permease family protein n=1 Tax=Pseudoduganella umbonata TaxID=864828 RepID=A0A4P8HSR2_9BURK|nr:FtsX-like permease family protein [Pseudoduganella umbonata]MBB3225316.1 putative ABC transport system permease protein [Pseudoduganella umbonata]QCP12909.1 FtsX-like permease family protein [Pseudoduganella umbonata]